MYIYEVSSEEGTDALCLPTTRRGSSPNLRSKKGLGVLFDEKMTFMEHIDFMISYAYSRLGLIIRVCSEFRDSRVLKVIYFANVRFILEHALVVWSPNCVNLHLLKSNPLK